MSQMMMIETITRINEEFKKKTIGDYKRFFANKGIDNISKHGVTEDIEKEFMINAEYNEFDLFIKNVHPDLHNELIRLSRDKRKSN